jgi:hypothetical protein
MENSRGTIKEIAISNKICNQKANDAKMMICIETTTKKVNGKEVYEINR